MARFFLGFIVATVLWGGTFFVAFMMGAFRDSDEDLPPLEATVDEEPEDGGTKVAQRRSRRRARNGSQVDDAPRAGTTRDDDLGENRAREVNMEGGGEAQLPASVIENVFGAGMNRIRRCLVLVEGDGVVRGRLTFGIRIEPSGRPSAVNLTGPSAVTTGEAGDCLRTTARGMVFPAYDGPAMVAHYPVTLE